MSKATIQRGKTRRIPRISISDARIGLNTIDEQLGKDCPLIEVVRHGKPVFYFVDVDWLECMEETLDILSDPETAKLLHQSLEDIREGRLIDHEEVGRELGAEATT